MRPKSVILAASIVAGLSSPAFADETASGIVTTIDRTTGVIVVQQTQSGTVGASGGNPSETYKVKSLPENLHAGDKVNLSYTSANGTKTVTKLEEQK